MSAWKNDVRTMRAARQTVDSVGTPAIAMGHADYHEGVIAHSESGRVVVASGGKCYLCRRVHHSGNSWLQVEYTAPDLGSALRYAAA